MLRSREFLFFCVLGLFLIASRTAASQSDDEAPESELTAAEIVDRMYHAYVTAETISSKASLRIRGAMDGITAELSAEGLFEAVRPDKYKVEEIDPFGTGVTIVLDPHNEWTLEHDNGETERCEPSGLSSEWINARVMRRRTGELVYASQPLVELFCGDISARFVKMLGATDFELQAEEVINNERCFVVFAPKVRRGLPGPLSRKLKSCTCRLFIRTSDYALLKIVVSAELKGFKPTRQSIKEFDASVELVFEYTDVRLGENIDPARFAEPKAASYRAEPGPREKPLDPETAARAAAAFKEALGTYQNARTVQLDVESEMQLTSPRIKMEGPNLRDFMTLKFHMEMMRPAKLRVECLSKFDRPFRNIVNGSQSYEESRLDRPGFWQKEMGMSFGMLTWLVAITSFSTDQPVEETYSDLMENPSFTAYATERTADDKQLLVVEQRGVLAGQEEEMRWKVWIDPQRKVIVREETEGRFSLDSWKGWKRVAMRFVINYTNIELDKEIPESRFKMPDDKEE